MPVNFDLAHAFTAKWEGGLVDHPADPGGITNHGVSFRFLQGFKNNELLGDLDVKLPVDADTIRGLTKEQAKYIFRGAFWNAQKLDEIPMLTAIAHYDFSVNSGSGRAVRSLQGIVGAPVDGLIGPETRRLTRIAGSTRADDLCVALKLCTARQRFLEGLSTFATFGKGWTNRVNALREYVEGLA